MVRLEVAVILEIGVDEISDVEAERLVREMLSGAADCGLIDDWDALDWAVVD